MAEPLLSRIPHFGVQSGLTGWNDLYLQKTITHHLPGSGSLPPNYLNCKKYPDRAEFLACVRQNIVKIIKSDATCWIPDMKSFLTRRELNLPPCLEKVVDWV